MVQHAGQVSLPGGACDPGEDIVRTALRETEEEIGVPPESVRIIGHLTPLFIHRSNFCVYPVVGASASHPEFMRNPLEVDDIYTFSIEALLDEHNKKRARWTLEGVATDVPIYDLEGKTVWGATAMILSEFEQMVRAAEQVR